MLQINSFSVILFLTSVVNFIVPMIGWPKRKPINGIYFAMGLLGVTLGHWRMRFITRPPLLARFIWSTHA